MVCELSFDTVWVIHISHQRRKPEMMVAHVDDELMMLTMKLCAVYELFMRPVFFFAYLLNPKIAMTPCICTINKVEHFLFYFSKTTMQRPPFAR